MQSFPSRVFPFAVSALRAALRARAATRWPAIVLSVLALGLGACDQPASAPGFRSTDVSGADFGKDFSLIDFDGKLRTLADFRGKVVVMFFGFTHCPDVCPTTLAQFAQALKMLGADADRVQVLMVTVDPERDTPEVLKRYVSAFDPRFLGLTGDAEAIARTAREFKVVVQKNAPGPSGSYSVDHSSGTYIFDPAGRLRLYLGYGQGADVLAHDVGELLRRS